MVRVRVVAREEDGPQGQAVRRTHEGREERDRPAAGMHTASYSVVKLQSKHPN